MNIVPLLLLAVLGATVFAIGGILIARRLQRGRIAEGHNDVLVPLFLTGGTLYAVFLAFLVVAVWESYDAAHANVAEEASGLATLYRASTGMAPEAGTELRSLVREYTEAVVQDEWAIQAKTGGASAKARAAGLGMYRLFGRLEPAVKAADGAIDHAALDLISSVQADRNKRTLAAGEALPGIMWFAAIGAGVLVIAMSFCLYMDRALPQMIVTSIMASTIALLLCITFVLSRPFVGPMALTAEPFEHSIEVFDAVDKTP